MLDTLDKEKSTQFMIFDDSSSHLPSVNGKIYSVWNVKRDVMYTADQTPEHLNLIAIIRTIGGTGKLYTNHGVFTLPTDSLIIVDYNDVIKYFPIDCDVWEYQWYNVFDDINIPTFEYNKVYSVHLSYDELRTNNEMFSAMKIYNDTNIAFTNALFNELVLRWVKIYNDKTLLELPHAEEIYEVISYIDKNLDGELSVEELASMCYLSPRQFRSVFKNITGLAPKSYVCRQRLKKVATLLKTTSESITDISSELKYSSPFQMSRDFKEFFGVSPKDYRKKP